MHMHMILFGIFQVSLPTTVTMQLILILQYVKGTENFTSYPSCQMDKLPVYVKVHYTYNQPFYGHHNIDVTLLP